MKGHRLWLTGLSMLWLASMAKLAGADPNPCTPPKQGSARSDPAITGEALSARIDALIKARLETEKVKPAPLADDAEFFRRVYLDVGGRTPDCMEVEDFLDDRDPQKRQKIVTEAEGPEGRRSLLSSAGYVKHSVNVWRSLLLPQNNNQQTQFLIPDFEK